MMPYLVKIYIRLFDTGVYPEIWSGDLIVPIHNKGDRNDPNNYRRITFINYFTKPFTLVLRNRINRWSENNDEFNDF